MSFGGRRRTAPGFTLVEVLVALAIVTVGASAVLAALSSSADTSAYLRDKAFAKWIALNRIAEVRLAVRKPTIGESSGEVEFAGRRWRWQQTVEEVQDTAMLRIDVRIRPADVRTASDVAWYATVSGVTSDAVAPPRGDLPLWSRAAAQGGGPDGDDEDGDSGQPGNGDGSPPEEPSDEPAPPPDEPTPPEEGSN